MKRIGNNFSIIIKLMLLVMFITVFFFSLLYRKYIDDWKEWVTVSFCFIFILTFFLVFVDSWMCYDDSCCIISHIFWKKSFFLHEITMILPGRAWGMYEIFTYSGMYFVFYPFSIGKMIIFFNTIKRNVPSVDISIPWYEAYFEHSKSRRK